MEDSVWTVSSGDAMCAAVSGQLINDIDWDLSKQVSEQYKLNVQEPHVQSVCAGVLWVHRDRYSFLPPEF